MINIFKLFNIINFTSLYICFTIDNKYCIYLSIVFYNKININAYYNNIKKSNYKYYNI